MSGDTIAVLGAHRATQANLNARMDRMEATLNDLRRDVTDIDRRLSRIEGAVLGPWRPEPPTEPPPERAARQEPVPASGAAGPRQ